MITVWTAAAHWIAQPWGTIALLVAGCLLLYHDLLTPRNWGVSGSVGLFAVALVFAAQLTIGTGRSLGVVLLLIGLSAVLVEVHALPGRGSAFAGFILMFAGMFVALGGTRNAVLALSVTTFLTLASGLAFLAYLPKSPAWQRVGRQLNRRAGLTRDATNSGAGFVGHTGRSVTRLKPTGFAEIDGLRLQVVTEGEFLEPGTTVVVTEVTHGRIVVHEPATGAA